MPSVRLTLSRLPVLPVDATFAALVALVSALADGLGADYRPTSAPLWDLALAGPLVLRRRLPATAAALLGLVCLAQWMFGPLADGDFCVLIMLYSLGVHESRRWVLACAVVVAELGVVLAVLRWGPSSRLWQAGLMMTGTVTAAWVVGVYVRTHRAYLASMINRAENAERDRDVRATIAVQAERARMAREMHDIIAHSLSVMITLTDAATAVPDPQASRRTSAQASVVGRQAMEEMQRLLDVLRADAPAELAPQPGTAQLGELVDMVRAAGLAVELTVAGELADIAATVELALYRIVQESLTNVLKHATNVQKVLIDVERRADRVTVTVRNDGDVVDGERAISAGYGLAGMRERVSLHDGRLRATPAVGGGWLVEADLASPTVVGVA